MGRAGMEMLPVAAPEALPDLEGVCAETQEQGNKKGDYIDEHTV